MVEGRSKARVQAVARGLPEAVEGDISVQLHPVALSGLNGASGTDFSERSASALYCVASRSGTNRRRTVFTCGGAGTPTLVVDGEYIPIAGDVDADIIDRLNG